MGSYRYYALLFLSAAALLTGNNGALARNEQTAIRQQADSSRVVTSSAPWLATDHREVPQVSSSLPKRLMTVHNQGNIQMSLINNGAFAYATYYWSDRTKDPFSGEEIATVVVEEEQGRVVLWINILIIDLGHQPGGGHQKKQEL